LHDAQAVARSPPKLTTITAAKGAAVPTAIKPATASQSHRGMSKIHADKSHDSP
jgi:hypothetical protein